MNPFENPVDFHDRQEVEDCLTFAIVCVVVVGIMVNLFIILT